MILKTALKNTSNLVSAKAPLYMASNRPIFAVGPIEIEPIKFLSAGLVGYTCTTDDVEDIKSKLVEFISDTEGRTRSARMSF